ncbi:DUF4843 domain-containing protein [Sphingobacterium paucimobilis]|nr:DUF4843 domain-containing protein [Sphingobacterium paucimobilis]
MKRILLLIFLFSGLLNACKQDEYYIYNDEKRIQFGPQPNRIYTATYNMADTLKMQNFFYKDASIVKDTVYFDIYAIGGVESFDRQFVLEQEEYPHMENAVAGVHYVPFNDPGIQKHYMMKADSVHAVVPIFLIRDQSLANKTVSLKFKLKENDFFKLGERTKLFRRLEITDRLTRPSAWTDSYSQYYYGTYSVVKHEFMIEVTGEKWDSEFIENVDPSLQQYYLAEIKKELIKYKNDNGGDPLLDENGVEVTFP